MKIINYDKNIFRLLIKASKLDDIFSIMETMPRMILSR
jgi:hypothetical protein